jgi:subfamily B ATP-binding cassette protein HlyB/CyaB
MSDASVNDTGTASETVSEPASGLSGALFCVALWLKMRGIPVEDGHLAHHFGQEAETPLGVARILTRLGCKAKVSEGLPTSSPDARPLPTGIARILTRLGGKAKADEGSPPRLDARLFPLIAEKKDGTFVLLAKYHAESDRFLVQAPGTARAIWQSEEELGGIAAVILARPQAGNAQANAGGGQERRKFGIAWFFQTARKYTGVLRDCLLASLFVQFLGLLSPLVFMIVIDRVLGTGNLSTLDVLVFALVVVSAFEIALSTLRSYLLSHTANRIDLSLGIAAFRHLMSLPLSYFDSRLVGDTIARMKELETVRRFITGAGLMLFIDLLFVIVFLAVMLLFSPFLTLLVVFALPFLFGASFAISPFLHGRLEDRYSQGAENQSFLVETISGIQTIKSGAAEPLVLRQWEEKLGHHAKSGFTSGQLASVIQQATTAISKVLSVLLLWFGAREVLAGHLTIGQLIAFNMLSSRVIAPVLRLSQVWQELQQLKISVARIADIFNCAPEPGFTPGKVSLPPIKGEVRFERVSFRYRPDEPFALHDISFVATPGEVVGIVGASGSGKTSLVKLLQRLYVPEEGRIVVDGVDLAQADASWLRRQIGVVVQDGVLFNGSIRDNITLNRPDLPIEQVMTAARLAGADEFISRLPEGYDSEVGERGLRLSTGQRQRLAIARALAGDPAMLIFDEATSSLDYEAECHIQENMLKICQGRTAFIVAHRLSTLRHANRILSLTNGKLVENDSPETLLRSRGQFAAFHAASEQKTGDR